MLDADAPDFVEYVKEIVDAIIPVPLNMTQPYWNEISRQLMAGAIICFYRRGLDFSETMLMIRSNSVAWLCNEIMRSEYEEAKMFIKDIVGLSSEHQNAIGSTLNTYTTAFSDPRIVDALSRSEKESLSWKDLDLPGKEQFKIFLCINEDRLEQWSGVLQLMITQLICQLERRSNRSEAKGISPNPILIMLDEFPRLGKMDVLKNALPTLRSKNVTFMLMVQSVAQLDDAYGDSARKILIENCDYKVLLSITEPESQDYFSKMIGDIPSCVASKSENYNPETKTLSFSTQIHEAREHRIFPEQFGTNKDIWLVTPDGFVCAIKKTADDIETPEILTIPATAIKEDDNGMYSHEFSELYGKEVLILNPIPLDELNEDTITIEAQVLTRRNVQ